MTRSGLIQKGRAGGRMVATRQRLGMMSSAREYALCAAKGLPEPGRLDQTLSS